MLRQTFTFGKIFGIRVGANLSWIALFALVIGVLAHLFTDVAAPLAYAFGAAWAVAIFGSVLVHEFAHAFAARAFGVRTRAITLFLFGGVAMLEKEPATPSAEAAVALAGPLASAALAAAAVLALFVVQRLGVSAAAANALAYVAVVNGLLAVFNLIPAFPMDGGRVLRAVLWARSDRARGTRLAARIAVGCAAALAVGGMTELAVAHEAGGLVAVVIALFMAYQSWPHASVAAHVMLSLSKHGQPQSPENLEAQGAA